MLILRGGRREGSSYVFDGGYRLNQVETYWLMVNKGDDIIRRPK